MSLAMFKLESFSHPSRAAAITELTFCRDDVDQAYADGYSAGKAEALEAQMSDLHRCLAELSSTLSQDESRRSALRNEAVAALAPVLTHILDLMAPAAQSRQLEGALGAELQRLSQNALPVRARISCGAGLRTLVERCVQQHGLSGIEISDIPQSQVNIRLEGGRIEMAPDNVADEIRALLAAAKDEVA